MKKVTKLKSDSLEHDRQVEMLSRRLNWAKVYASPEIVSQLESFYMMTIQQRAEDVEQQQWEEYNKAFPTIIESDPSMITAKHGKRQETYLNPFSSKENKGPNHQLKKQD